jgi:excisionase family DNA binding protein
LDNRKSLSILVSATKEQAGDEEDCMQVEDRLFNIAEVAARLGMSKDTIHNWIKAGRLKASRIGRF